MKKPDYIGKWNCSYYEELQLTSHLWDPEYNPEANEFQLFVEYKEPNFTYSNEIVIRGFTIDCYGKSPFEGHINKITNKMIFTKQYDKEAIKKGAYNGALYYEGLIKKMSKSPKSGIYISGSITGEKNDIIKPFLMKKRESEWF